MIILIIIEQGEPFIGRRKLPKVIIYKLNAEKWNPLIYKPWQFWDYIKI